MCWTTIVMRRLYCRIVFSGTYESARQLSIFYDAVSIPQAPLDRSPYRVPAQSELASCVRDLRVSIT